MLVHGVLSLEQRLGSTNDVGVHSSVAAVTVGIRLVIDATKVASNFPPTTGMNARGGSESCVLAADDTGGVAGQPRGLPGRGRPPQAAARRAGLEKSRGDCNEPEPLVA